MVGNKSPGLFFQERKWHERDRPGPFPHREYKGLPLAAREPTQDKYIHLELKPIYARFP